jgi:hypothetical protein
LAARTAAAAIALKAASTTGSASVGMVSSSAEIVRERLIVAFAWVWEHRWRQILIYKKN